MSQLKFVFCSLLIGWVSSVFATGPAKLLDLTTEEKQWLEQNPVVKFTGDPNWLPYEAFDAQGNYIGIVSEHLNIISELTGLKFEMSPSQTWTESTEKAKQGLVDILSETDDSDLKSHLNFTLPYVENPIVIAMRHSENYVENIDTIKQKKIALIKDYGYASKIRRKYNYINFVTVEDIQDGLISVSTGKVDALLCTLALCSYTISELNLNDVKITGKTEFDTKLALGVQQNQPELLSVLNKAINQITHEQQQVILDRWIKEKFVSRTDYSLAIQIFIISLILVSFIFYWARKRTREVKLLINTEKKLYESQKRYQALFDKTADALLIIDGTRFIDCNQATLDMLGYATKEELYNTHPSKLSPKFQPDGQPSDMKADLMIQTAFSKGSHRFEWDHVRKNGEVFPVEVLLTAIPFDNTELLHVVWRDITDRKSAAAEIEYQAFYDSLTGLANRTLMIDRLKQALITSRRHHYFGALLFIDLDRFKSINDSLGHSIGDKLLIESAKRINECIWDEDTACRFGGDEYLVMLRHAGATREEASQTAETVAQRIQQEFNAPFIIDEHEFHVSNSIGIALFPFEEEGVEDIIKQADTAMYSAKENGRNQYAFYLSKMHEKMLKKLTLEKDLRKAINDNRLEVYYQPLLDINERIISVEALARWNHPQHGFIEPEEFIAIAEDTGLIYEIGEFVLNQSVSDITSLNSQLDVDLSLSVNISPQEFRKNDFITSAKNIVETYKLKQEFLTLEITERIAIENLKHTIKKVHQLHDIGVRISLDDFGTGYSSLNHLKSLPIDEIKIDQSFVFDIETDPQDAMLVKAITNLAHQFNLQIVAEGVENKNQLEFLKNERCHIYQGYYYSKPLDYQGLMVYIEAHLKLDEIKKEAGSV